MRLAEACYLLNLRHEAYARCVQQRLAFFLTSGMRHMQDAFGRGMLRGEAYARGVQRGLLSLLTSGMRHLQDAFSEACFPFDLNDEAMRDFPFLFSLTDHPGEGPPYQLCSSRVSVRVFPSEKNNSFHVSTSFCFTVSPG